MLALLAALSACAAPPPAPVHPPAELASCRDAPPTPAALPRIRTKERTAKFAIALELAREAEHARGDECADRLARLNEWVATHD